MSEVESRESGKMLFECREEVDAVQTVVVAANLLADVEVDREVVEVGKGVGLKEPKGEKGKSDRWGDNLKGAQSSASSEEVLRQGNIDDDRLRGVFLCSPAESQSNCLLT